MTRVVMLIHETSALFGASFPDFPGCTTVADSLDALIAKAPAVLDFHVKGLQDDQLVVPVPRSLDTMWADPIFQEDKADAALVTALDIDLVGHSVRIGVSLPEEILASIDKAAEAVGETRSAFLTEAALMRIDHT